MLMLMICTLLLPQGNCLSFGRCEGSLSMQSKWELWVRRFVSLQSSISLPITLCWGDTHTWTHTHTHTHSRTHTLTHQMESLHHALTHLPHSLYPGIKQAELKRERGGEGEYCVSVKECVGVISCAHTIVWCAACIGVSSYRHTHLWQITVSLKCSILLYYVVHVLKASSGERRNIKSWSTLRRTI